MFILLSTTPDDYMRESAAGPAPGLSWALKLLLLMCVAASPASSFALGETFKGTLIPNSFDAPIPIVVDLDSAHGRLLGRVETSSPLKGGGPITSGEKIGSVCKFASDIGSGIILTMDGQCFSTSFEGKYTIHFGARNRRHGTFSLPRLHLQQPAREKGSTARPSSARAGTTTAACLKGNTACLAACPRGDYNIEFMCANRCRQNLVACRGKVNKLQELPSAN